MIPIDTQSPEFTHAREKHISEIGIFVLDKIQKSTKPAPKDDALYNFIKKNLTKILGGLPDQLLKLHKKVRSENKETILKIFDYANWVKKSNPGYNGYSLAKNLNIPTCPYCNRLYTKTVFTDENELAGGIIRPTFDHWFPKSKYPLLALSFYNLIPSCNICNQMKSTGAWDYECDFHPYLPRKKDDLDYRFSYKLLSCDKIEVELHRVSTLRESVHAAAFTQKLKDIYKEHRDEVEDLLRMRQAYSDSYLKSLHEISGLKISIEEVYRLAFGTYPEEKNFHLRPLSKLKHDILQELGIFSPEE